MRGSGYLYSVHGNLVVPRVSLMSGFTTGTIGSAQSENSI